MMESIDFNKVEQSVKKSFNELDQKFLKSCNYNKEIDVSGSCAIVIMIVDNNLYVINTGDSRAIMSKSNGKHIQRISNDQKPDSLNEFN